MTQKIGTGRAIGHHGELIQGAFLTERGLRRGLVSLPCPTLQSHATYELLPGLGAIAGPDDRPKALEAVKLYFERHAKPQNCHGRLSIHSNIPVGRGFGSSTADIVAAIRAASGAIGRTASADEIADLAVRAEIASDSTMYAEHALLFAHRDGYVLEYFGGPYPPITIVSVDSDPDSIVDTVELEPARYEPFDIELFACLRALVRRGLRERRIDYIAKASTSSAVINQRHLPKKYFDEIQSIGSATGSLGLQVAHSGTVIGLLYDAASATTKRAANRARDMVLGELKLPTEVYSF